MIRRAASLIICSLCFLCLFPGCFSKEDATYIVPDDIYGITLERREYVPDMYSYSDSTIASGKALGRNDFQVVINSSLVLRIHDTIDVNSLEFIKEYDYGLHGTIREYKESTGNYKVLVASYEGDDYLVGFLTLSKYVRTYRGIRNGLSLEEVDVLMGTNTYEVDSGNGQESRIYSIDGAKLIITSKYGVVRSLQILVSNYN